LQRDDVTRSPHNSSFDAAVLPHLGAAYDLAYRLMRDAAAAEDVLQEAMLRALIYFAGYKGVNARGWLLRIVRNAAYSSMNLDRGIELVPITGAAELNTRTLAELQAGDDNPEDNLIRGRDQDYLQQMIRSLPVELRETLVLREMEELSYKEIAEITQIPIGTVMSRLWRARQLLVQAASKYRKAL
jgi:RNA polymerase sigma factor (sigma-70 family)